MSMWTEAEFILPEQYTAKQIEDEAEKLFDCVSVSAKGKLAYISIGELSSEEAEEADLVWPGSKERIDIIGTNGNTAEHYAIVHKDGVYEA